MVHEKQRFKYLHILKWNMGTVKVLDEEGEEKTLTVSTDVEAQVLATRELARAMGRLASRPTPIM